MMALLDMEIVEFQNLATVVPEPLILIGCNGVVQAVSSSASSLLNFPTGKLIGQHLATLTGENEADASKRVNSWCQARVAIRDRIPYAGAPGKFGVLECDVVRIDDRQDASSSQIIVHVLTAPGLETADEEVRDFASTLEALRESEARKSAILESALDCIITMDHHGCIVDFNPAAEQTFGYSHDQVVGKTVAETIVPESLREAHWRGMAEYLRTGHGPVIGKRVEVVARRSDGTEFPVELAITPHQRAGHPPFFTAYIRDITDRIKATAELQHHREELETLVAQRTESLRQSHEKLRMSERMASIGTLAAGIGHDMGNLLLPIRSRLDALSSTLTDENSENADHLKAIEQSTNHIQALTRGLRLLALDPDDPEASGPVTILNQWWTEISPLLKASLPRSTALRHEFEHDLPPLRIGPHRLTQVVANIVSNCSDALRSRQDGVVTIAARFQNGRDGLVILSIADNGSGMSDQVRARALDPFFTTKPRAISTGLGLSLAHGILTGIGGDIEIQSSVGQGTTVTLRIPAAPELAQREGDNRPVAVVAIANARTRMFVLSLLELTGYEALVYDEMPRRAPPEAIFWITDVPGPGQPISPVTEFLRRGRDHRAVLFGESHADLERLQIPLLEASAPPSRIREVVQRIAQLSLANMT